MTSARLDAGESIAAVAPPTVSVVVVNYNLSRFLREAVESVMRQTYTFVECVIVDDASTDDSRTVIADLASRFPQLRIRIREHNGGSTMASLDGLAMTSGPFVHFLDADDIILETFLEAHVAAHLSVRYPVGFSCCDMLQVFAGQVVARGDANVSRYLHGKQRTPSPRSVLPSFHDRTLIRPSLADLYLVDPWHVGWPWTATSAIVYRRRALDLFRDAHGTEALRASTDAFFALGINAIAGSVVLDEPLAIYRHHGGNAHLEGAPLDHVLAFERDRRIKKTAATVEVLIDHVIVNARRFDRLSWHRQSFFHLLKRLCAQHPGDGTTPRRLLWRHRRALVPVFGRRLLVAWMLGFATDFGNA